MTTPTSRASTPRWRCRGCTPRPRPEADHEQRARTGRTCRRAALARADRRLLIGIPVALKLAGVELANAWIIFALLFGLMLTGMPISISLGLTVLTFLFTMTTCRSSRWR